MCERERESVHACVRVRVCMRERERGREHCSIRLVFEQRGVNGLCNAAHAVFCTHNMCRTSMMRRVHGRFYRLDGGGGRLEVKDHKTLSTL